MCTGKAPDLEQKSSFVGRWMDILRPGYEAVSDISDESNLLENVEKQAVLISLQNLMTFPFVKSGIENERLSLHGLWTDIGEGSLSVYDPNLAGFAKI